MTATRRSPVTSRSLPAPPSAAADGRRFASVEASARYLGVSVTTVRRYIAAGELTAYRLGTRLLRIDLDEVDAVLRQVPASGGVHV